MWSLTLFSCVGGVNYVLKHACLLYCLLNSGACCTFSVAQMNSKALPQCHRAYVPDVVLVNPLRDEDCRTCLSPTSNPCVLGCREQSASCLTPASSWIPWFHGLQYHFLLPIGPHCFFLCGDTQLPHIIPSNTVNWNFTITCLFSGSWRGVQDKETPSVN